MTRRLVHLLGAGVLAVLLVASTNGAQAAAPGPHFFAPMHPYGPNGMRLGLHCETRDRT